MQLRDVTVATMTRVGRKADERPMIRALALLADRGLTIVVSDRGSSRSFVKSVSALPGVRAVPPLGNGLVGQIQASLAEAARAGTRFILYTEPDKHRFFDKPVFDFIDRADDGRAGILLAARSARAFGTFPPFQRCTETAANELCARMIGVEADYFYGPFLLARGLAAQVSGAPPDLGWGWRPFLFHAAHRLGYRIASVVGPYRCPPAQRVETERDKEHRVRQLVDNVGGLIAALDAPAGRRRAASRGRANPSART